MTSAIPIRNSSRLPVRGSGSKINSSVDPGFWAGDLAGFEERPFCCFLRFATNVNRSC
ncbi:MAG: hypothetical protein ACI9G1_000285 [Pirellulaceae bacterium]|jgi:hypothetical protein